MYTPYPINRFCSFIACKIVTLLLFFSILFTPQTSFAAKKNEIEIISVQYIPGWEDENMVTWGAIKFTLNPGWKTYWKKPGPFGIPPVFNWSKSENIQDIEFFWPTPKIFHEFGTKVIGYKDVLTIPLKIIKISSSEDAILNINLEFGICSDICLLKTAKINSPIKDHASNKNFDLINKALKKVPSKVVDQIFSISQCSINRSQKELSVSYLIHLAKPLVSEPTVIIDYAFSDQYVENRIIRVDEKTLRVNALLTNIHEDEGLIERNRLITLLIFENESFELSGCG